MRVLYWDVTKDSAEPQEKSTHDQSVDLNLVNMVANLCTLFNLQKYMYLWHFGAVLNGMHIGNIGSACPFPVYVCEVAVFIWS